MRLMKLGLAALLAVAACGAAWANCHGGSSRAYQEYMAFKREVPPAMLAKSAALVAQVDAFFREKYPLGQLRMDYVRATEADISANQREVIADYKWLQGRLKALRAEVAAQDPNLPALTWLAYVELPIVYEPAQTDRLLRKELPKLAEFRGGDAFATAKYDGVFSACAASLERAGKYLDENPGGREWFALCGMIQPRDKRQDGHMQLTHSILDNLAAYLAYTSDQKKLTSAMLTR